MEATKSARKGVKAAVPEPPSGTSIQDSFGSAQGAASSALNSITEGESLQCEEWMCKGSPMTSRGALHHVVAMSPALILIMQYLHVVFS